MAHVRPLDRKDGTTAYEVRWRQHGKFRQRTFTVKREAERFALRMETETEQGNNTELYYSTRGKTVGDVVEASMAVAALKLKPRTLTSYRQSYDNHILPALGSRRISSLSSQDVEQWVAELRDKGLSPATVRNNYVALNKVFRYAVRHKLVAANPCTGTELPKATGDEVFVPKFLTPAEVEKLAAALDPHAPYGLLVRFAAYTGLRAGELAGLRVHDVNLLRRHIEVRRTVQRVKGGWATGAPKSAQSTRNVPLRAELVEALALYLDNHPARNNPDAPLWPGRVQGGHGPNKSAFTYARAFDHQSFYRYYFTPAAQALGLGDVRFHDLRHTYASIMAAAGVEIHKVSRWMGHANISTTDSIYTHLFNTEHTEDMSRVDEWVGRQEQTRPLSSGSTAKG